MALTEGIHDGEFLLSEGNGYISREKVTIAPTTVALPSGTVMGKITASGKWAPYDDTKSTGIEVAKGVLYKGVPISTGDQQGVIIARLAEVASARLTGSDANGVVDLAALNIIVRA